MRLRRKHVLTETTSSIKWTAVAALGVCHEASRNAYSTLQERLVMSRCPRKPQGAKDTEIKAYEYILEYSKGRQALCVIKSPRVRAPILETKCGRAWPLPLPDFGCNQSATRWDQQCPPKQEVRAMAHSARAHPGALEIALEKHAVSVRALAALTQYN
ncbi:hypothetical protein NDU88_009331 [Pleurodeles waltl]|uniref:Uncharacterized protein n=1 Tax=Pleurodeles waltl TaxID=8319 RepID=A0AAV7S034_PLEWA|nr:hypothetical protein NDU88_009331 [Pleurodeles waltl]